MRLDTKGSQPVQERLRVHRQQRVHLEPAVAGGFEQATADQGADSGQRIWHTPDRGYRLNIEGGRLLGEGAQVGELLSKRCWQPVRALGKKGSNGRRSGREEIGAVRRRLR